MRNALLEWKDVTGDKGNLQIPYHDASIISISLYDNSDDTEVHACHDLDIPTARAIHEALGRALEEVDPQPITDSISATLAACSDSVPDILRKIDAACGESQSAAVVTGPDGMRVHRSLRSISTAELAKLGLKPKAHLPSDGYLLECGHWSIHKQWCTECAADIVAISQRASQPEPSAEVCDTCFGCGWQVNNHAPRLRCECGVEPWVESDPEPPTLHPRPFFWDSNERFGFVNVAQDDILANECMTVAELLQHIPNALDAHQSHHPLNPTEFPNFGFRLEHDGPRTLREYLEAPDAGKTA